ncbi:hypothetical protein QN224_19280 [Sinorhizobium sp. 8-89]|uniref:hypothetical protein n=1 Tax=Sinorhizobium sp. 7-81 TaxID=3049087 RepID=UPI0024C24C8A|nr:hypothetical protein [Sinorhizobium sp. 7-81]MDK1387559.1 hypothetical protein [Sinorhizobium sp. 7-81]
MAAPMNCGQVQVPTPVMAKDRSALAACTRRRSQLLICDDVLSGLDALVQTRIIELLKSYAYGYMATY